MALLAPDPIVETVPGYCMRVQVPDTGKPLNITVPVGNPQVGGVIVPTEGALGIGGWVIIVRFADWADIHPIELVTLNVKVPDGKAVRVIPAPEPEMVTPPGFLVKVQVPVVGNPLKTTVPVEVPQVGCVISPITGAEGEEGGGAITTSADTSEVHPSALVTIKLYVPAGRPDKAELLPLPWVIIDPGFRARDHVPGVGNPFRITLPVGIVHDALVMVPITGALDIASTANV